MLDPFKESKERFATELAHVSLGDTTQFNADPWVISSLLQKSIRRAETAIAQRAALTLLTLRGSAIWRRFMIIAFEDIGAASLDAVTTTIAVGSDPAFRNQIGGNALAVAGIAALLSKAAKDRSADYLGCGPKFHPSLFATPRAEALSSLDRQLNIVTDWQAPLFLRSLAAWQACGIGRDRDGKGDLPALLASYRKLAVPEPLIAATAIAAQRTREPIVVMVPLIWLAAHGESAPKVQPCSLPPAVLEGDLPLYALDEHTRLGREAIFRFAQNNRAVRSCLQTCVCGPLRRAAHVAAFYTDAYPITPRLMWPGCLDVEAFGIRNDLLLAGVRSDGIEPLLQVFRGNLAELNEVRREVFRRAQSTGTGPG